MSDPFVHIFINATVGSVVATIKCSEMIAAAKSGLNISHFLSLRESFHFSFVLGK